jgi:digeranylgeranylglycerophospholipid reductase
MREEYDVVVVGCGPAGTSAAKELASKGLKVLALERNQEIGTPVRCGEGLSENSVKTLGLDIPRKCIASDIEGAVVYTPAGRRVEIKFEGTKGFILERKMFDKWLAEEAARAGAEIIAKSNVTGLIKEGDHVKGVKANVMGEEKEIRSKVVIAADGVESLLLREAGIRSFKNPRFTDSGVQYEMAGIDLEDPNMISLYFGNKHSPRGYIWVFPKGKDTANVGIGIGASMGGEKSAKQYLDEWIATRPGIAKGSILEVNGGAIPVGDFLENMVGNGILGVGDSVSQVNPIHGGGISESIKAARIAASVISGAIQKGDTSSQTLSEYNTTWWKERGESLRKVERVREIFEKLNDDELSDLGEVLSGHDLTELAHGRNIVKLATIYARFKTKGIKRKITSPFRKDSEETEQSG